MNFLQGLAQGGSLGFRGPTSLLERVWRRASLNAAAGGASVAEDSQRQAALKRLQAEMRKPEKLPSKPWKMTS